MPEDILIQLRSTGIELLSNHLRTNYNGIPLTSAQKEELREEIIKRSPRSSLEFRAAWKLPIETENSEDHITVVVDNEYPVSVPIFLINPVNKYLVQPHIEKTGKLCILSNYATISPNKCLQVFDEMFKEAKDLLDRNYSGVNQKDFNTGFESYWQNELEKNYTTLISLIDFDVNQVQVDVFKFKDRYVIAESENDYKSWGLNLTQQKFLISHVGKAYKLLLNSHFPPSMYPNNLDDVYRLPGINIDDIQSYVNNCVHENAPLFFILIIEGDNGIGLGGLKLSVSPEMFKSIRSFRKNINIKLPFYKKEKFKRLLVERADKVWINQRAGKLIDNNASQSKILVIGNGSLGSDVVFTLAKTGIENMILIDPDDLLPENIARHILGMDSIYMKNGTSANKAFLLKSYLERINPYLNIKAFDCSWRNLNQKNNFDIISLIDEVDCIVSLTGIWSSDCALNYLVRKNKRSIPIIFGWIESYGYAGHALAVLDFGGCYSCGANEVGLFKEAITKPKNVNYIPLPRCGEAYSPQSYLDIRNVSNIVSALIIDVLEGRVKESEHRYWVASEDDINQQSVEVLKKNLLKPYSACYKDKWPSMKQDCYACL